jgi:ADP-ribose pyrophosphatase YjhB (NUDIX family)
VAYRQRKVGAAALIQREGGLLLVRRGPSVTAFPDSWNLPSGYCEVDEPPQETVVRETREETGLEVVVGSLVDVYPFDDDPRGNGLLLVYEAEVVGGSLQVDGREASAAEFFAPDQLPQPLCGGGHDQAIAAWRARSLDRWQPGAPLRYCPHCGHRVTERLAFDRVRPVCPICDFIHFREPKVGVSVLIEQEGRVLLVQRGVDPGLDKWALPSGFIEWDEAPEVAAVRECGEETGLVVVPYLLTVSHYTDDYRGPGINLLYGGRVVGGRLQPGDDAQAARFFAPEDLPEADQLAFRGHCQTLAAWCAGKLP